MNLFEKDDLTLEELNNEWKESTETKNVIKQRMPMRIFHMAKETYERDQKEKEIVSNIMYEPDRRKVKNVLIIDKESAIIETFEKIFGEKEQTWYRVCYNGRVDSTVTTSFDNALIQLICLKHKSEEASGWICKMLDIKEEF